MKTECLILLIGIKGIDNQSIALAKNLDLKFKTIKIKINLLIKTFPFFGNIFNNLENNFKLIEKYNFKYLITTGKKLSGVSAALKKLYGDKIINIHLQKPNFYSEHFDILVTPEHDDFYRKKNVIKIVGSLSPFNEMEIKKNNPLIEKKFKYFKSPNVLVLLGGKSKRYTPTNTDYSKLLIDIKNAAKKNSANVVICQSRRTPDNILYLAEQIFADFKNHFYISKIDEPNIYPSIIKLCNYVIVTNDSVNMISEIASTNKNLFLGYLNKEKSKLKSFHEKLLKSNNMKIFKKSFYSFKKIPLDNKKKLNKDFKLILNKLSK